MKKYIKHTENNQVLYLIPVRNIPEGTIFLNATKPVKDGIREDKKSVWGYEYENGPNFSIEITRAQEYAEYLDQKCDIHSKNFYKYDTRKGYSLFLELNDV